MLLLQTVIVQNLTGYHDIDCKFVFVLFNWSSREFIYLGCAQEKSQYLLYYSNI